MHVCSVVVISHFHISCKSASVWIYLNLAHRLETHHKQRIVATFLCATFQINSIKANVTLLKFFVLVKSFSLHSVRLRVAGVFGGHMICKPCLRYMHSFARLFLLLACEWRFHQNPQGPQTISCLLMLGDRRSSRHFGGWMLQSIRR